MQSTMGNDMLSLHNTEGYHTCGGTGDKAAGHAEPGQGRGDAHMSDESAMRFEVPGKLDGLIEIMVAYARRKEQTRLADVLTASTYTIEEGVETASWDEVGHAIHFFVPSEHFMLLDIDNLGGVEDLVRERLNNLLRAGNEYIAEVTIEIGEAPAAGSARVLPSREANSDLWGNTEFLRLFITHKSEDKEKATQIRDACQTLGIACFVAHEDIEPTTEWQSEIERALQSMDALLALLTPGFHDSNWTDQEVGAAVGRQIPVIPVRSGCDPYGFIGKYQAIQGHQVAAPVLADQVVATCLSRFASTKAQMKIALVTRFERAKSFDHTRKLMGVLESVDTLPGDLVGKLEAAPAGNSQIAKVFGIEEGLERLLARFRQPNDQ